MTVLAPDDVDPKLNWNDTQTHYTRNPSKRAYYLSLEFLMGRTLDNAVRVFFDGPSLSYLWFVIEQLLNLGLKKQYTESVDKLGFTLEDLLDQERDAALGNGGLGRLAACYLDSAASQVSPVVRA
jgi:starch phosphorylase